MKRLKHTLLNRLLNQWQNDTIVTSHWLSQHGYSHQLIKKYCDSKWLNKIGQGAYAKLGDEPYWTGGIFALQQELGLPVHVGGVTALDLYGLGHNVVFQRDFHHYYLFNTTENKYALPKWFIQAFPQVIYAQYHLLNKPLGLETKQVEHINLSVSSPELAILEVLALVPHAFDYEHANHLIENGHLLRAPVLQELLEACTSVKVKRLFLYLADKYQLPCFAHINQHQINLGKGKRVIGIGGVYSARYQLSVPKLESDYEELIGQV